MKKFRVRKETEHGETFYSFYTNDEADEFTGLDLIDVRVNDPSGQKVRNHRYGGGWVLRNGRDFISDRYGRPIAFETVKEAVDAVEDEFQRWARKQTKRKAG